jgi:hypothetical protein
MVRNECAPYGSRGRPRPTGSASDDLLAGLRPVLGELVEALVGEDVAGEGLDHGGGGGDDVGSDQGAVLDVVGAADRGRKDLGLEVVVVIDRADVADQVQPVEVDVVKPPDEGRDEGRPGLGGDQGLVGREAEGDVDHEALTRQDLAGLEAVPGQRDFHRDIGGDGGKLAAFGQHVVGLERDHFGGDRALDEGADLLGDFQDVAAGFQDEGRVGGDAVHHAEVVKLTDGVDVGGVDEEFHGGPPWRLRGVQRGG